MVRFTTRSSRPDAGKFKNNTFYADAAAGIVYVYTSEYSTFALAYPGVSTYAVALDPQNGTIAETEIIVEADEKMSDTAKKLLESITPPEGYTLDGWYTEDGKKWDFSKDVEEDMTLQAKWTQASSSNASNASNSATTTTTANTTTGAGGAAEGGRGVNSPQTSDRIWALWGAILLLVVLNGAYIAHAAKRGRKE